MSSAENPIKVLLRSIRRKSLGNLGDDPAENLLIRKYQRLRGLYEIVRSDVSNQAAVITLEKLISDIDKRLNPDEKIFSYPTFSADIHRVELALIQVLPINELAFFIEAYREDYRDLAGNEAFLNYVSTREYWRSHSQELYTAPIRAEATYLLNQIERYKTLRSDVEMTREFLIRSTIRSVIQLVVPLALPVLIYVVVLT